MNKMKHKKFKKNISQEELNKFNQLSRGWWDKNGTMKSLHDINPLRFAYVKHQASIKGKHILDVGCGGGLLTEQLAREGGVVTGIDASEQMVAIAGRHARQSGLDIRYIHTSIEDLSSMVKEKFDIILCMELLEHVPDFKSVIRSCKNFLKPNGSLIFATINRNPLSFVLAIICAEYIMGLLPKGTHGYKGFIKPEELSHACTREGLTPVDITGFSYNPVIRQYYFCNNSLVNFLACYR